MRSISERNGTSRSASFLLLAASLWLPGIAAAVDFPLSGTITVNGNTGALPDGGVFAGSNYDPGTGAIGSGTFTFPQATTTYSSPLGPIVVTYQLSQTNQSSGQVAGDAVAALTAATLRLQVISAMSPFGSINVGTCIFEPIDVVLDGTGSAAGLDLADAGFTIPPVAPIDCGGNGSQVNQAVAGDNNSIVLQMIGDFTPPSDNDAIFEDGFEIP